MQGRPHSAGVRPHLPAVPPRKEARRGLRSLPRVPLRAVVTFTSPDRLGNLGSTQDASRHHRHAISGESSPSRFIKVFRETFYVNRPVPVEVVSSAATRTQHGREFESQTRTSALCFSVFRKTLTPGTHVSATHVHAHAHRA